MLKLPFYNEIEKAQNILIAGAGGGFDIFSGLPLYFGLKAEGKQVHLANLSFSFLPPPYAVKEQRLSPSLFKVTADAPLLSDYFPEKFLSLWFREQGEEIPIYCFERTGVRPLLASYQALVNHLGVDTIILVDGGTDSLMRGDEIGLGTPQEDSSSILAVNELKVERKMLACLGFGVDAFHGVCHAHFLEAVAELTRTQGYLGMFSLLREMHEVQQYIAATKAVFNSMPRDISIVSSSIMAAIDGNYGDYHSTPRTRNSQLWINPLMPVYWCFQVAAVAERILYRDAMMTTENFTDVSSVIREFRNSCKNIRPRQEIPV
ncbi:MAG: DUF1152 domain-containing protein [Anaerolineales bacterium]